MFAGCFFCQNLCAVGCFSCQLKEENHEVAGCVFLARFLCLIAVVDYLIKEEDWLILQRAYFSCC